MKKGFCSAVLGLNALALIAGARADLPPFRYTVLSTGTDTVQKREILLRQLGASEPDLLPYRCDGNQEYVLFPKLLRANRAGNSLRIKLYGSSDLLVYKEGSFYSIAGDRLDLDTLSDPFLPHVADALEKLEDLPTGKVMLDRLEHSPYPLRIVYGGLHFNAIGDDGKSYGGTDMAAAVSYLAALVRPASVFQFDRIGTGGDIGFDPLYEDTFVEADMRNRAAPPHVLLAHEMFHAFDAIRGLLDRRSVSGEAYEFINAKEYRATYLENRIRKESGLKYRKYYESYSDPALLDGQAPKGSLLGPDGKPMLIPAPCL